MSITRREFLQMLAVAAPYGLPMSARAGAAVRADSIYDLPKFDGNVTLLHFTDCHAQLLPTYFREPDVNLGINDAWGKSPHLVGDALLTHFRIRSQSRLAHVFTHLDFEHAARRYGKVGGF